MIAALTNHLWHSTLFVLAAALLAAALRKNGAHVRYWVWVAASVKFVVPFALLMSLGGMLPRLMPAATPAPAGIAAPAEPDLAVVVDQIAQPFSRVFSTTVETAQPRTDWMVLALLAIWACGFAAVASSRLHGWRRVRAAVRASTPVPLASPIPVRAAPGLLEPGVVGLWRPVLLVPAGLERHLTPAQLDVVIVHELCHVRRRDNLTAAIHMLVEAAFWFHPFVWWIGARLVDERERACDEHVLRVCGEPEVYAESILSVCKLYVESPLACVSGVTGSDLKKRIEAIMINRIGLHLNAARKLGLAAAAGLAVALPVVAGMITAPLSASTPPQAPQAAADRLKFDVVSIKPCPGLPPRGTGRGAPPWAGQISPGYVHWDCVTLGELIDQAYAGPDSPLLNVLDAPRPGVDLFQRPDSPKSIRGGPSWVDSDRFTIEAKISGDAGKPELTGSARFEYLRAAMTPAVRAMIEDRFQLKVHRATEQRSMYALTVAKGGVKLTPTAPGDCWVWDPATNRTSAPPGFEDKKMCGNVHQEWRGSAREYTGLTLPDFAEHLSRVMDHFVLDKTGVDGQFNFVLTFEPDDHTPGAVRAPSGAGFFGAGSGQARTPVRIQQPAPPARGDGPTIFKALEALGLKLEPTKGPAEYFVIDHVEKPRPNSPSDTLRPIS